MSWKAPALPRGHAVPAALLLVAMCATPLLAQDDTVVLPPKKLTRPFPQGQFCALKLDLPFTADGASARIVFTARRFVPSGASLQWTEQYIDNVAIAAAADHDANFGPPPAGSNSEFCYDGDPQPTPYFYLNRGGLTLPLLERFDSDPAARGWDLANGAYFRPDRTAPRDVENELDYTGGSLGLGADSATPAADDTASTSITVNGLTKGQEYNLSAWWDVNQVQFPEGFEYLTITVYGSAVTPVTRRTWGSVKNRWR